MITGKQIVNRPPSEVLDRLKLAMAGGNFQITKTTDTAIHFKHGTYITQSAPLFPKKGVIRVAQAGQGTEVSYEIDVAGFAKYLLLIWACIFCPLIFPPIVAHRVLIHHPRRLMENLLQALR